MAHTMTQEQILRYLELVEKRLFILTHSGVDWKPEYEQELAEIDREISSLRKLIDSVEEQSNELEKAEDGSENIMTVAQAAEKALSYDYQAFYERWLLMSPFEVFVECREVLRIYDILQQEQGTFGLGNLNIDGFMESMQFLENFCMRYLVDIFFSGQ